MNLWLIYLAMQMDAIKGILIFFLVVTLIALFVIGIVALERNGIPLSIKRLMTGLICVAGVTLLLVGALPSTKTAVLLLDVDAVQSSDQLERFRAVKGK